MAGWMMHRTLKMVAAAAAAAGMHFMTLGVARAGDMPPVIHETVINAPVEKVWSVFTTAEGYKLWGVALADVDFRIGGKIRSRYAATGELGDDATIEQTILAYDPMRMVAFRCTKTPKDFPFPGAMAQTWSTAYFDDLGGGRTRLTLKGFGYTDAEDSMKMREFFVAGNAWSLEMLKSKIEGTAPPTRPPHDASAAPAANPPVMLSDALGVTPIIVEAVVDETPEQAFARWTTLEGLGTFFGEKQKVELKPGGPFEIYFSMQAPEGERGSEGCTILSYDPGRMLSFTWNAPPKFPEQRAQRTWVVVTFNPETRGGTPVTRVRLAHHGWSEHIAQKPEAADIWREVRGYFVAAWPMVLSWHQEALIKEQQKQ